MHPELQSLLADLRKERGFNAHKYLSLKAQMINDYFLKWKINSVVVGVSGGVDSAVVLGLLAHLSQIEGSPLKKIVAALLPVKGVGTTGQDEALRKGRAVCQAVGEYCPILEVWECDLSSGLASLATSIENGGGKSRIPWGYGQVSSVIRTPALYYIAALLQENGNNVSLVVGTTNRSEGAYIGFFGKASDGMVDIQPISDIHKSEVYALAHILNIPGEVINAVPVGDVWDGRNDEQMFGSSYEFLELYQLLKCSPREQVFSEEAEKEFQQNADAIERMHSKNLHKYLVGSPAVHFDVMERKVP